MGLTRTVTAPAAGSDGTATWAGKVYNDIGSIIDYRIMYTNADAATITFDMSVSCVHKVVLGASRILAVSNVIDGQSFCIMLKQDASGSRTVTWWSGILWMDGTTPTLTTTGAKTDIFTFTRDGSSYYGTVNGLNL